MNFCGLIAAATAEQMKKLSFVMALAAPSASLSAEPLNGNFFHQHCNAHTTDGMMICAAFVNGIVSGAVNQIANSKSQPFFCIPPSVIANQSVDVFSRYLSQHPERRHMEAGMLAFHALSEAFPCDKQ